MSPYYSGEDDLSSKPPCENCGDRAAVYRELMDGVFCLDCYNQWVEKRIMEEPLPTIDELQDFNPYPAFWPDQGETAIKIIDSVKRNEKIIGLSAPTASGKSGLLATVARWLIAHGFVDRVIYTTPQVKLVDSLAKSGWFEYYMQNEESEKVLVNAFVVGRSNYPCAKYSNMQANCCVHRQDPPPICDPCEFNLAREAYEEANFALTTFDYFLSTHWRGSIDRELLIVDESSDLEELLLKHLSIKLDAARGWSNLDDPNVLDKFLLEWYGQLLKQKDVLLAALAPFKSKNKLNPDDETELRRLSMLKDDVERNIGKCERIIGLLMNEYFIDEDYNFRLLRGRMPFQRLVSKFSHVILSSGTPTTSLLCEPQEYTAIFMRHPIPVERRRVFYVPIASMTQKNRVNNAPSVAQHILELHNKFHKHTLVHCHSYDVGKLLKMHMPQENVILQQSRADDGYGREIYLDNWMKLPEGIFLCVKFNEGYSFQGPDYPLNIIAKVPFASLDDTWQKKRMELDNSHFYNLNTAVYIEQAAGRCTRTPEDYSETYILDSTFGWWYRRHKNLFEPWFQEAVINPRKK